MTVRGLLRHLLLALLVLAGLAFGHDLVFRLAADAHVERVHLLAETGHGAWGPARLVATGVLVLGVVALASPAHPRTTSAGLVPAYARIVVRLALLQTVAFVELEVGERLAHGTGFAELAHDPVLAAGTLVQLAVGLLGGLLLVAAHRLVTSLPAPLRPSIPTTGRPPAPSSRPPHRRRLLDPATGPRAPPCPA